MGFLAIIIIYEVVMRYGMRRPTTWVSNISELLLVYSTFLIAALVLRLGGHVKVDVVQMLLNKRWRAILGIIQDMMSLFFCVVFAWLTWAAFWNSFRTQERSAVGSFSFPMWVMYVVIPFGAFLLCLQLIKQIVDRFIYYVSKSHPVESKTNKQGD